MLDQLQTLHSYLFSPDRIPVVIAAMALSSLGALWSSYGALPLFWRLMDFIFGRMGQKMDRVDRSVSDLLFRGFILTVIILAVSFAVGRGLEFISATYPMWKLVEILSLAAIMVSGRVWAAQSRLYKAMVTEKTVKGAFLQIARATRTDLSQADEFTITRTGMGMTVKMFDKGVVAPAIWFLIAGLPAAFLYAGLAFAAWRFGKEGFTKGFGRIALELEKLMGFVPNIFAGMLVALAGVFTPTGRMSGALRGFAAEDGKTPYFEGGLPVTAMAFALDVSLGGVSVDMNGSAIKRVWAGPPRASAQLTPHHLARSMYIVVLAHILFVLALLGAMIFGA